MLSLPCFFWLFCQEFRQYLCLCEDAEDTEVCEEIERLYSCIDNDSSSSSSSSSQKRKRPSKQAEKSKDKEKETGGDKKKTKDKKSKKVGDKTQPFLFHHHLVHLRQEKKSKNKQVKNSPKEPETQEEEQARAEKEAGKQLMKDAKKAMVNKYRYMSIPLVCEYHVFCSCLQAISDASGKLKTASGLMPHLSQLPSPEDFETKLIQTLDSRQYSP